MIQSTVHDRSPNRQGPPTLETCNRAYAVCKTLWEYDIMTSFKDDEFRYGYVQVRLPHIAEELELRSDSADFLEALPKSIATIEDIEGIERAVEDLRRILGGKIKDDFGLLNTECDFELERERLIDAEQRLQDLATEGRAGIYDFVSKEVAASSGSLSGDGQETYEDFLRELSISLSQLAEVESLLEAETTLDERISQEDEVRAELLVRALFKHTTDETILFRQLVEELALVLEHCADEEAIDRITLAQEIRRKVYLRHYPSKQAYLDSFLPNLGSFAIGGSESGIVKNLSFLKEKQKVFANIIYATS